MFVALYMPAMPPGRKPKSRKGFETEDAAWSYALQNMCLSCIEERLCAITKQPYRYSDDSEWDHDPDLWPACSCEWEVLDYENFLIEELTDIEDFSE